MYFVVSCNTSIMILMLVVLFISLDLFYQLPLPLRGHRKHINAVRFSVA